MAEECANPLLLGWLKEWMDEAQARNSKGFTVLDHHFYYVTGWLMQVTDTRKPISL